MVESGTSSSNPKIVHQPTTTGKEQALRFKAAEIPGGDGLRDVAVVSGYAVYDDGWIVGDEDDDDVERWYLCRIIVGPKWRKIRDVSPSVAISGITDTDPDEVDFQRYDVISCVPVVTGSGPAGKSPPLRIRLDVLLVVAGGWTTNVTKLAYHLVATGALLLDQDDYFAEMNLS